MLKLKGSMCITEILQLEDREILYHKLLYSIKRKGWLKGYPKDN
jgi:hypothetical protein